MKFLCVQCDKAMKLQSTETHEEIGSLSVIYRCPDCEREFAMLTNPYETQLVQSLGVKIGPDGAGQGEGSKCPFASMVQGDASSSEAPAQTISGVAWTGAATERLQRIPEFIRPMAKAGIEKYAGERGYPVINESVLDEARDMFGM